MDKIIGFAISKENIKCDDVDVFNANLNILTIKKNNLYINLWGIGELENCKVDGKYTLSFPITNSLLDRNVLITINDNDIIVENDWLNSIPVFYNQKELIISTLSLKTLKDKQIDNEGLKTYLEFGYSALEHTAFKDVKFLRYYSKIEINDKNLTVNYKDDPVLEEGLFNETIDEEIALQKIKTKISNVEKESNCEIVIPTSGGYDSRVLNILVSDKSKIRSFTYGVSKAQNDSFESLYAKKISEILNTKWEIIELGNFHKEMNNWFKIFGFSTHLHGMYHIEFYKTILQKYSNLKNKVLLSGIIGDAWSGNVKLDPIDNYKNLSKIGYTHSVNVKEKFISIKTDDLLKKAFFEKNSHYFNSNVKVRIIFSMRFKLMLLSYLFVIPEYLGFVTASPFLDFDVVLSMLKIPDDRRKDRLWQKEFFKRNNLDIDSLNLNVNRENYLDYQSFKNMKFEDLDIKLMGKFVDKKYLENINKLKKVNYFWAEKVMPKINNFSKIKIKLINNGYTRRFIEKVFFHKKNLETYQKDRVLPRLSSYYVIKSIEKALINDK
ncbi:MAG: hypothetical protein A2086_11770 [Spirochaetes bacterium GWD1_27_9]|nr:MAG: hypothetical protein A2Z98_07230 [Spirochaetes bacterium GWB1_27_13]OHD24228.1 MAG: hypothetical protein A2Y34_16650 [Spirochaetes bacterium GWC1_27_15]OHD28639.1 MAG: hypothetical protein A2086_11770 [Spirochaetes bacterium GWD1_27_9]